MQLRSGKTALKRYINRGGQMSYSSAYGYGNKNIVSGFGFDVDLIDWDFKKLLKRMGKEIDVTSLYVPLEDILTLNDLCDEIDFEKPFLIDTILEDNKCDWLHYENGVYKDYVIIYDNQIWGFSENTPKTENKAKEEMWNTIKDYVQDGFTYNDFLQIVDYIEDEGIC